MNDKQQLNNTNRIVKLYDDLENVLYSDLTIYELEKLTGINYTMIYKYREGIASLENITFNNAVQLLRVSGLDPVDNLLKIRSLSHKALNNSTISIYRIGKHLNISNYAMSKMRDDPTNNIRLNRLCLIYEYYYIK